MRALSLSIVTLATVAFLGCGGSSSDDKSDKTISDNNKSKPTEEVKVGDDEVPYTTLAYETNSSLHSKRKTLMIVDNQTKLNEIYSDIADKTPPSVDFDKNNVLAIYMGRQATTEYALDFYGIKKIGDTRVIEVLNNYTHSEPGTFGYGTDIGSPYYFISYPKPTSDEKRLILKEKFVIVTATNDDSTNTSTSSQDSARLENVNFTKLMYLEGDNARPEQTKHFEVIDTQERFDKLYEKSGATVEKPSIDFSSEIAFYIGMGYFSSGGYSIDITNISKDENYTKVDIQTTYPGDNCPVTSVMTAPRLFAKIAKNDSHDNIIFNETRIKQASCD